MTLEISYSNRFKKELKKQIARGRKKEKFAEIIKCIASGQELSPKYRNHKLVGNYKDRWECHIEPDWLLIYKLSQTELVLERTGTHSDLFD